MTDFHNSTKLSNFTEICPFEAAVLRTDKCTNMTILIGIYRDYANEHKNSARLFQDGEL
jgi:hypothetical protein